MVARVAATNGTAITTTLTAKGVEVEVVEEEEEEEVDALGDSPAQLTATVPTAVTTAARVATPPRM